MAAQSSPSKQSFKDIDIKSDAQRVFSVLQKGGLAITPTDVGYAIVALTPAALERAFTTKRRGAHKRHAMIGSYALHREIHVLPEYQSRVATLLVRDLDLPLGVVAPYRPDHPMIQALGEETLARSLVDGTLSMLVNGGTFQDELSRLAKEANLPLMGSSANLSGQGTKTRVEDIEKELLAVVDIVIDHGKRKFSVPRPSSTMIDFRTLNVLRFGACYDVVQDVFKSYLGLEMPEDPGRDVLFSGHVGELKKKEGVDA